MEMQQDRNFWHIKHFDTFQVEIFCRPNLCEHTFFWALYAMFREEHPLFKILQEKDAAYDFFDKANLWLDCLKLKTSKWLLHDDMAASCLLCGLDYAHLHDDMEFRNPQAGVPARIECDFERLINAVNKYTGGVI